MNKKSKVNIIRRNLKSIVFWLSIISLIIIFRTKAYEICYVPSESMEPTILRGDLLIYDKVTFGAIRPRRWADVPIINIFTWITSLRNADKQRDWGYYRYNGKRKPRKGDIIVFHSPENKNILLVKRIAYVVHQGITLKITSSSIKTILTMAKQDGVNMKNRCEKFYTNKKHENYYIPKQDYYYVMGDNQNNSVDSRWFGYIPEHDVIGKMKLVLFSWDSRATILHKLRWNRIFHSIS
jgi:signal peptidase I